MNLNQTNIKVKERSRKSLKKPNILIALMLLVLIQSSCKKSLDIPTPIGSIGENVAYSTNSTAISVLSGIYSSMSLGGTIFTGSGSISVYTGLSSDELNLYKTSTGTYRQYFNNSLSAVISPLAGSEHWASFYKFVFKANAAIEGLTSSNSSNLLPAIRQQLLGEAKFLRAFYYFYLVNEFGDVPIALTTDPKINANLSRTAKADVYKQIIVDLKDAQQLLSSTFLDGTLLGMTAERTRPTKWAATALLARAYLYTGEWANAEAQSTQVINNNSLFTLLPNLNNVFKKTSLEAIWQLQPTDVFYNTQDARVFIIPTTGPSASFPVYLSKNLVNSFEANDQRKVYGNWVDTVSYKISTNPVIWDTITYVKKYKINTINTSITQSNGGTSNMTEYVMALRLAEQFLIRAEARAKLGNTAGAQSDLNAIRNRAGLNNTNANDPTSILTAILRERQVELFSEFGHRWFDLKRTGNVDAVMTVVTPQKANGASWKSYQQLYPLPQSDLYFGINLVQNTGY